MRYRNGLLYPNKVEPPFRAHLRDHESKYPLISCALKHINDFSGPTKVSPSPELRCSFNRGNKYKDMWTFFTRNKFSVPWMEASERRGSTVLRLGAVNKDKCSVVLVWSQLLAWQVKKQYLRMNVLYYGIKKTLRNCLTIFRSQLSFSRMIQEIFNNNSKFVKQERWWSANYLQG